MAEVIAVSLFAAGYLAITMEHRLFLNKAATSLLLAVLLWVAASMALPVADIQEHLATVGNDVFSLVIFLLASMTLVEILVHYHFFDLLETRLRAKGWTRRGLGWSVVGLTFLLSMFLANLTVAIVMIQIARRLFPKEELLAMAALVVITSNAGGAFSPVGDVTTLMLWFAQKFSAMEVITQAFLPSVITALVPAYLLIHHIPKDKPLACQHDRPYHPSRSDKAIMTTTLGAFFLPLGAAMFDLPPYMGLLLGLGFVWILIDVAKRARPQETHLGADIHRFLQQCDIESIQFFVGILLSVGALHALGVLDILTHVVLGVSPNLQRIIAAFTALGAGSAIVDNVPITAAAISALEGISSAFWVLLAVTVGTGGSLLVIGSASGVVAQGMLKDLTFGRYLKIATWPAFLGFIAAIAVWAVQYKLFLA